MNQESAWNMYVFRDGRRSVPGPTLARALRDALDTAAAHPSQNALVNALLLAGEFECALTDALSPDAHNLALITETVARKVVSPNCTSAASISDCFPLVPENPPAELRISPAEGFAYYALHPLDFADLAREIPLHSSRIVVIGIRSIGVTLSALVLAALESRGLSAERLTVRPTGHPYNRQTHFTSAQRTRIEAFRHSADFLIVDEGPGMSGSSFLSVADALLDSGVPRDCIALLGSRIPDPDQLRADNASARWRSYRSYFARKNSHLPHDAVLYIGGGDWRRLLPSPGPDWPASWTQMERLKFLSPDKSLLYKFEGFGRYGQSVHDRSLSIAAAGFGPAPLDFTEGFCLSPVIEGTSLRPANLTPDLIDHLADYCAFRSRAFPADTDNSAEIATMMRFNVSEEFALDLPLEPAALESASPVLTDARMLPHEWLLTASGDCLKVDAASHCDDHFFPGPCDIAWDLAGAIVEWDMPDDAISRFLSRYRHLTSDDPSHRLPAWITAYAVFRSAYCKMAAAAMTGSGEEHRLFAAHQRYRAFLHSRLSYLMATSADPIAA